MYNFRTKFAMEYKLDTDGNRYHDISPPNPLGKCKTRLHHTQHFQSNRHANGLIFDSVDQS